MADQRTRQRTPLRRARHLVDYPSLTRVYDPTVVPQIFNPMSYQPPNNNNSNNNNNRPGTRLLGHIPRKKLPPLTQTADPPPPPVEHRKKKRTTELVTTRNRQREPCGRILQEFPFILRIPLQNVPLHEGIPRQRASKRKRVSYQELNDTDSDDFLTDDEDLLPPKQQPRTEDGAVGTAEDPQDATAIDPSIVDAPPPGVLNTLWYSRECFLHIHVLEKCCGWKTRSKVTLVDNEGMEVRIDKKEASLLQQKTLQNPIFWADPRKRMEVSRIAPEHCPVILSLAFDQEEQLARTEQRPPKFTFQVQEQEEVLLVKWRGRSHLHCSWERASDIQRLDPNNTARNKIKRFYQAQEIAFGENWKDILEEERRTAAAIHSHGESDNTAEEEGDQDDYFPNQYLEVERILACDENDMNMEVLAKQRAINAKAEEEVIRVREGFDVKHDAGGADSDKTTNAIRKLTKGIIDVNKTDSQWDPEDNVRYVVKWKGLPYSEITWEYWRDIKRDAVDHAEDFWYRQKPPSLEEVHRISNKPHPHIKDFRKLQESRTYGISKRARPAAILGDNDAMSVEDDEEAVKAFKLRVYQLEGVNWLLFNWWNKRSCILADEMGLGKTIQSAAFLQELQSLPTTEVRGPFLIVAPLSLVGQWQSELASWAPDMNVVLYHGSADARDFLVQQEFWYTDQFVPKPTAIKLKKHHITKFHVLITTYEVVLKDISVFSKIQWRVLIVDEAHRLKNPRSRLFEELSSVPRDHCVLLTGTPIANATEELWALLHFANPSIFKDKDDFLDKFGQMTDAKQVSALHSILKPYLLRRVKEDVEKSLPPKEETILEVSLTPVQKTFYKAIYERNTSFLFKGAKPSNAPSLMNVMMELRKCCNHPYLVKGAEERILNEAASKLKNRMDAEGNEIPIDHLKLFEEQLVKSSGKMVLMEKLLHKLFNGGHKVLIFSQMVRVLDLLEELLKLKRYKYERLDGSTSSSSRVSAVDRFSRKSCQRFVMLLSTRAGGLGLNLTAADTIVIFDSDWNPQNDLQAMARAHRIGQTRAVRVYRLLTAKTYEMHMFHSASLKLGLERAVLSQNRDQGDESDEGKPKKKSDREAQAKEIDELLKKGAYDVFRDEDDEEARKFMESDIDQLLERSSKKVTYGLSSTQSIGGGLGSFSKASFVADTGDGEKDVDLDDPDFWSKAIGLEAPVETPDDVAAMIDDGVKRNRKQVQVYDPYAETAEAEQRRKERIAYEKQLEKEEKERLKFEKKSKKKEAKEKKRKDRDEQKIDKEKPTVETDSSKEELKKLAADAKPKKSKKNERLRALRRAENEDPLLERLKQAWEITQRNRASAAVLRFGFGRFCKIRGESNLTSLPTQDIEVFLRAYIYQIALQCAVSFLVVIRDEFSGDLRNFLKALLAPRCSQELEWISDSIYTVLQCHNEVENARRFLRIPVILAEPSYVEELRNGAALRALRRIGVLARLNRFIEDCLDFVLGSLGHQELGRRGCVVTDFSTLDVDLKSRFVTTEELALIIGQRLGRLKLKAPTSWWDRKCDVGLIIGAFVHGLSNYIAMRNDSDLPFEAKLQLIAEEDEAYRYANQSFRTAAAAARSVFDDALESARVKAELEVQAAVAAAAKAALKREADAEILRKGGIEAEAVISNMPDTQVENAFEFDGTDSHFVTLPRMVSYLHEALQHERALIPMLDVEPDTIKSDEEVEQEDGGELPGRRQEHFLLPMPDSRILDFRFLCLLKAVEEDQCSPEEIQEPYVDLFESSWEARREVTVALKARTDALMEFMGDEARDFISEYNGVGIAASQCASKHRSLNDGSDFGFGSASAQLVSVAYGTDSPRYLRAVGIPMNITRFAISGLVYAEASFIDRLLKMEHLRFFGAEEISAVAPSKLKSEKNGDNGHHTDAAQNSINEQEAEEESKTKATDKETEPEDDTPLYIPVDPLRDIPERIRSNAQLRSAICLAVIYYGLPSEASDGVTVHKDILELLNTEVPQTSHPVPVNFFSQEDFRDAVLTFARGIDVPEKAVLCKYVEDFLLPHCVRLCVYGNGPTTRSARGSEGKYDTALGVSIQPDLGEPRCSPIPDPCLSTQEHSLEAVGQANALLRRVRLLRACQYICRGEVSLEKIQTVIKSKYLSISNDLPVWWCPWIHDLAFVIQAASHGVFSIIPLRSQHPVFSVEKIREYLHGSYIESQSSHVKKTPPEKLAAWTSQQARKFPTLFQLESRLALFCSQVTAGVKSEDRYDSLPFFDHGAWPRK